MSDDQESDQLSFSDIQRAELAFNVIMSESATFFKTAQIIALASDPHFMAHKRERRVVVESCFFQKWVRSDVGGWSIIEPIAEFGPARVRDRLMSILSCDQSQLEDQEFVIERISGSIDNAQFFCILKSAIDMTEALEKVYRHVSPLNDREIAKTILKIENEDSNEGGQGKSRFKTISRFTDRLETSVYEMKAIPSSISLLNSLNQVIDAAVNIAEAVLNKLKTGDEQCPEI